MPTPLVKPATVVEPFAVNGSKNTIPAASQIAITPGAASLNDGFPPLTMTAITAGGVPPSGLDFNGILNLITQHTAWINGGGGYTFDATLSAFIGGYPAGSILQSNDGLSEYVSLVNSNTTDFNATPASIGTLWQPFAGKALLIGAGALVYVNSNTAVVAGAYLVDTSGGSFTLTLPAAPALGATITFIDARATWGSNVFTLARNGKTIMGQAVDFTVNVSDQQFSIWFNGTDWRLV